MSQFREKGYQIFHNVIPSELVATLHRLLASEVDGILARLSQIGVRPDIATAAHDIGIWLGSPRANVLDQETLVLMTGYFPTELRLSKIFWDIPRTPALQDILKTALRSDRLRICRRWRDTSCRTIWKRACRRIRMRPTTTT
jgi:hypothetical protein